MASVRDYGSSNDPLDGPGLPAWAKAVADALNNSDVPVDTRIQSWRYPVGNLLTDNQASVESGATTGLTVSNGTHAAVADTSVHGAYAVQVTGNSAGSVASSFAIHGSASRQTVTPGNVYTASVKLKAGTTAARAAILFYNTSNGIVGSVTYGNTVTNTSAYETSTVTAVAPAGAHYVLARTYALSPGVGVTYRWDALGLWAGAGGNWAMPGVPITGLGKRVTHPNTDDVLVQQWDGTAGRWQISHYDSGIRDLSGMLANGWTGSLYMRRVGGIVYMYSNALNGSAASSATVLSASIPGEWRPNSVNAPFHVWASSGSATTYPAYVTTGGSFAIAGAYTAITTGTLQASWSALQVIPTSLPGTLVTPAPA